MKNCNELALEKWNNGERNKTQIARSKGRARIRW